MKRLLAASLTAVLGVGLLVAPPAAAATPGGAASGAVTIVGPEIGETSTRCGIPGTVDEYRVLAWAYDDDRNVVMPDPTGWYIETVYNGTRTKMPTKRIKSALLRDGLKVEILGLQFANPDHLPYRLVFPGGVGQTYSPGPLWYGSGYRTPKPRKTVPITDATGWKSATLTPAGALARKVTIANPDGRNLTVDVKVGNEWRTMTDITLKSGVKSQTLNLDLMSDAAVTFKKGTRLQYRLSLDGSWNYREVGKTITVKYAAGKQKTKVKVSKLRRGIATIKVTSTQKVPSKVILQRKVGTKWLSTDYWITHNASIATRAFLTKGTYRVIVKAGGGLATKSTSKAIKVK